MTDNASSAAPRPINHVGVGVADLDAAIAWYGQVLGFRLISGPNEIRAEAASGAQAVDVLGPAFRHMRMAHLTSANGVGLELFQLIDPPHERRPDTVEFWKSGFFHICVTDPDIDALSAKIAATGGAVISKLWIERGETTEYRMCYCRDPFGNVIEIYTHSYELMQGHR
ncbi:VOC family protein [Labrys wisconsinensis]|uniref:Catechol 2,3-dioxygenase-like lactoylglutathione lyase family enzyme n=1 Tax=Labrys wisconsinensis TaxID=425677 RepID=A0ABU0JLK5_9HYPH|nr:VOC family protein [Labrys wisconsinensis]MDQ0474017.1 catechol 2,3-dioxygenase-like lactoylglutathione lyase family enzyme [Labrys wisconsinensis]